MPKSIKTYLRPYKDKFYDNPKKRHLALKMQAKHQQLLKDLKGKEKIKVVFISFLEASWKVEPIFQKMLKDPYFEPLVLVCPITVWGEDKMWEDMKNASTFHKKMGHPVLKSYIEKEKRWVGLSEIKPDLVFFLNPHSLTRKEYYEDAYLNYLSCYVPYAHDVAKWGDYNLQYNQFFHNAIWKIFVPHNDGKEIYSNYSQRKGENVFSTGYPACEVLLEKAKENPWKTSFDAEFKVIIAPHHSIEDGHHLSNFILYASFFKEIALRYKNKVQFAFKPHPGLKPKLYQHLDWGKEKTDAYYKFWEESSNTQLEEGEYSNLFKHSDAMIHDSGSFLAEYLYLNKPVLYLTHSKTESMLNPFGLRAIKSCKTASNESEITHFLNNLINNKLEHDKTFFEKDLKPFFEGELPSERIVKNIKNSFLG